MPGIVLLQILQQEAASMFSIAWLFSVLTILNISG